MRRMKTWKVSTTEAFDQWFEAQADGVQVETKACVEVLKTIGPHLGRPLADTLNGSRFHNMKELRVKAEGQLIRIAFAFDPQQEAILLTAGAKQGRNKNLFYKALIRKADELYAEHLKDLKRPTKRPGKG